MKTVTSISGGQTSAYLAANYPTDYNIFSLVRTNDKSCIYPDKKLRQLVSDKIGNEFIGTLEDDIIIHTILDLEQYIGKEIIWVSGLTFDEIIEGPNKKGGLIPNQFRRYCTTWLKVDPIFHWWLKNFKKPIEMNIGYRVTEKSRAETMLEKTNEKGLQSYKAIISTNEKGRNKWKEHVWRKPKFPLINDFIERQDINKFWKDKPVRFAEMNNCIGCFHRSASLLKKMSELHPAKFDWFIKQEKISTWKKDFSYTKIKESNFTMNIPFGFDAEGCTSGFCGY